MSLCLYKGLFPACCKNKCLLNIYIGRYEFRLGMKNIDVLSQPTIMGQVPTALLICFDSLLLQ